MPFSGIHLLTAVIITGLGALALSSGIGRLPFYRRILLREETSRRFHAIDGLRGFLALAVAFHHITINQQYQRTGVWALTQSRLDTFFGHFGVAMFFMITAFLFYGRICDASSRFDTVRFFTSRVQRLVPMYTLAAILAIVTALSVTHFHVVVSAEQLSQQIVSWLLFKLPGDFDINGLPNTFVINGAFWSLAYEWKFYLLIPFLAPFASGKMKWLVAALASLCIALYSTNQVEWFFVTGAISATVVRDERFASMLRSRWASVTAIALITSTALWQSQCYNAIGAALLFLPFVAIASGNSLFGLLTFRPARLLGILSYSIYLMHSWILYLISRLANHFTSVAALPEIEYWGLGAAVLAVTVALSAFTYRYVEWPWISATKRERKDLSLDQQQDLQSAR